MVHSILGLVLPKGRGFSDLYPQSILDLLPDKDGTFYCWGFLLPSFSDPFPSWFLLLHVLFQSVPFFLYIMELGWVQTAILLWVCIP